MRYRVKVKIRVNSSNTTTTVEIEANSSVIAKALAEDIYGVGNVLAVWKK